MTLYRPIRSKLINTRIKGKIASIGNRFLYNNIPPLTPGQVQSLVNNPEMTDQLINQFGPKIVQAMLNKSRDKVPPAGLIPDSIINGEPPKIVEPPDKPKTLGRKEQEKPTVTPHRYTNCVFLASLEMDKQSDDVLKEARDKIVEILNKRIPTVGLIVEFPDQVEDLMRPYNPRDTIVFNWADTLGGFPHGGQHISDSLARLGFDDAGSPPLTQELVTDRDSCFRFLKSMKVPVPHWRILTDPEGVKYWKHGYPALVRPNSEHGSMGLKEVKDEKEALKAVEELFDENFSPPAIMVEKIEGHEFSVGAWTDGETWEVLPIAEANFEGASDDIKGEDDKAASGASAGEQNIIPAKISESLAQKLGETTVDVLSHFGVNIWGRVDYRMEKGSRTPKVIDVNNEPDISEDTLMTEMAAAAGMSYENMILKILDNAIAKYERKWEKSQKGVAEVKPMSTGEQAVA